MKINSYINQLTKKNSHHLSAQFFVLLLFSWCWQESSLSMIPYNGQYNVNENWYNEFYKAILFTKQKILNYMRVECMEMLVEHARSQLTKKKFKIWRARKKTLLAENSTQKTIKNVNKKKKAGLNWERDHNTNTTLNLTLSTFT